jgi:hypothetical protein
VLVLQNGFAGSVLSDVPQDVLHRSLLSVQGRWTYLSNYSMDTSAHDCMQCCLK